MRFGKSRIFKILFEIDKILTWYKSQDKKFRILFTIIIMIKMINDKLNLFIFI